MTQQDKERRVDEADGKAYPLASFLAEYGPVEGRAKWEQAAISVPGAGGDAVCWRALLKSNHLLRITHAG